MSVSERTAPARPSQLWIVSAFARAWASPVTTLTISPTRTSALASSYGSYEASESSTRSAAAIIRIPAMALRLPGFLFPSFLVLSRRCRALFAITVLRWSAVHGLRCLLMRRFGPFQPENAPVEQGNHPDSVDL